MLGEAQYLPGAVRPGLFKDFQHPVPHLLEDDLPQTGGELPRFRPVEDRASLAGDFVEHDDEELEKIDSSEVQDIGPDPPQHARPAEPGEVLRLLLPVTEDLRIGLPDEWDVAFGDQASVRGFPEAAALRDQDSPEDFLPIFRMAGGHQVEGLALVVIDRHILQEARNIRYLAQELSRAGDRDLPLFRQVLF